MSHSTLGVIWAPTQVWVVTGVPMNKITIGQGLVYVVMWIADCNVFIDIALEKLLCSFAQVETARLA